MKYWVLYFLAVALTSVFLTLCGKQAEIKPKQMNYEELSKFLTPDIAFMLFDKAGKTENDTVGTGAFRVVKKKVKDNATLDVLENDLDLTYNGDGTFTYEVNPEAEWSGGQGWSLNRSEGRSLCNYNYTNQYVANPSETCPVSELALHRGWTSDKITRTVHSTAMVPTP